MPSRHVTLLFLAHSVLSLAVLRPAALPTLLEESAEKHLAIISQEVSAEFANKLNEQLGGLLEFHQLTEASGEVAAGSFRVFPVGFKNATSPSQQFAEEGFRVSELIDFLDKNVPDLLERVSTGFLQEYLSFKIKSDRKIVWALFDPNRNKKHIGMRTLAYLSRFTAKFSFISAFGSFDDIQKRMGVTAFPVIIGFFPTADEADPEGMKVSAFKYSGSTKYSSMYKFFELALTDGFQQDYMKDLKFPEVVMQEEPPADGYDDSIAIQSSDEAGLNLLDDCDQVVCALAFDRFLAGPSPTLSTTIETLRLVQKRFSKKSLRVVLLDGQCHDYLLTQVGLTGATFPALIAYNARTAEFGKMEAEFTNQSIFDFVLKMKSGGQQPVKLSQKLSLQPRDCSVGTDIRDGEL